MKRMLYLLMGACLLGSLPASADQAPFGPMEGRAYLVQVVTTTQNGNPVSTVAYLNLNVSLAGHSGPREIVCESSASAPDLRQTYCTPTAFLGSCSKTSDTPTKTNGPNGIVVTSAVTYCTTPGAGACRSIQGYVDENNRLRLTASATTGGCQ
jgi:hypothetical protein